MISKETLLEMIEEYTEACFCQGQTTGHHADIYRSMEKISSRHLKRLRECLDMLYDKLTVASGSDAPEDA